LSQTILEWRPGKNSQSTNEDENTINNNAQTKENLVKCHIDFGQEQAEGWNTTFYSLERVESIRDVLKTNDIEFATNDDCMHPTYRNDSSDEVRNVLVGLTADKFGRSESAER
jgi:hypothetical protein